MPFRTRLKYFFRREKHTKVTENVATTDPTKTSSESNKLRANSTDSAVFITKSAPIVEKPEVLTEVNSQIEAPKPISRPVSSQDAALKPKQELNLSSLWDEAYNELRKEDTELIDVYERDLLASQWSNQQAAEGEEREVQLQKLLNSKLQDIENSQMKISVNGEDIVIKNQIRKVVQSILVAKEHIGTIASLEPHATLAWAGVMILLPVIANPITQDDDAVEGLEYISELLVRCKVMEDVYRDNLASALSNPKPSVQTRLEELNTSFRSQAVSLYSQILRYQISLSRQYSRSGLFRFLRDCVIADDWKGMLDDIKSTEERIGKVLATLDKKTLRTISEQVAVLQNNANKSLDLLLETKVGVEKINQSQLLGKLHRAEYAAFNTFNKADRPPPRCLEGTRVDILREIQHWGDGHREECMFWLKGLAGTGKSTLARTVAHHFNEKGRLGASFFFSRGKKDLGDATAVLTTIALQLAEVLPDLKNDICDAIEKHGDIGQQPLYNQWQKLIFQPLLRLDRSLLLPVVLVFVLDALDECEGDEHLAEILQLLTDLKDLKVLQVKVFLTSRPERSIYSSFREIPEIVHHDLTLHSVPKSVIDSDISIFLRYELGKIKNKRPINQTWPGEDNIQSLVQKADRLFIYAATVCRFIAQSRFPEKRLTEMLQAKSMSRSSTGELDKMYLEILKHALVEGSDEDKVEMIFLFKRIVGSILILFEALPKPALTSLLDLPSNDMTEILESLHSVLDIPNDESSPIQLFHLSFRDFLLSEERCANPSLRIDVKVAHSVLLTKCFDLMSKHLKQDICELRHPGFRATDVQQSMIEKYLPSDVQYACRYWVRHLQYSKPDLVDDGEVHVFLRKHLLHWIESLSILGKISEATAMIRDLEKLLILRFSATPSLSALVYDMTRFILKFGPVIDSAPLQVYCSALVFSPRKSKIREQFWDHVPLWITDVFPAEDDWDPSLLTLSHFGKVQQVLFSPDGRFLISSGGDVVKAWDASTGTCRGTFPDISRKYFASDTGRRKIALSPDGKLLACTSAFDDKIRLWDAKRIVLHCTLEGHTGCVDSMAFSPDGSYVASTCKDGTMRLWEVKTGHSNILFDDGPISTGEGSQKLPFTDPSNGIAFSPNGEIIAGHIGDCQVRLWDTRTNSSIGALIHSHQVLSVAFSPDGKLIASSSLEGVVRIWNRRSATLRGTLTQSKAGYSGPASPFAFSADGELIACVSNETIELWDPTTLTSRGSIEIDAQHIACITFSADSNLLAVALEKHIKTWDPRTRELRGIFKESTSTSLKFSPNGQVLASGSFSVKLWDVMNVIIPDIDKTAVTKVKILGNGEYVACRPTKDTVELRDPLNGASMFVIPDIMDPRDKVELCSVNKLLAYTEDDTINLWNMETKRFYGCLKATDRVVNTIAFSPDGTILAASYRNHAVVIWDLTTKKRRCILKGHLGDVNELAISSDSQLLVSGAMDSTMRLWNSTTGELLGVLFGKLGPISSMVLSSDDQIIISKSFNTVTVWDINSKQKITEVDVANGEVLGGQGLGLRSLHDSLDFLPLSAFDWKENELRCRFPLGMRQPWVKYKSNDILWFPEQHRYFFGDSMHIHGNMIALAGQSGNLMFIRLNLDSIPIVSGE